MLRFHVGCALFSGSKPRGLYYCDSQSVFQAGQRGQKRALHSILVHAVTLCSAPQGLATVSLQWGAWAGSGMAATDARLAAALARAGMGSVTPQQGLDVLSGVLRLDIRRSALVLFAAFA